MGSNLRDLYLFIYVFIYVFILMYQVFSSFHLFTYFLFFNPHLGICLLILEREEG